MSLVLGLLLAASAPPPEVVGVVRFARGTLLAAESSGEAERAQAGQLLREGSQVRVENGWGELLLGSHFRVQLSAETALSVGRSGRGVRVALTRGRLWLELGRQEDQPHTVVVGTAEVRMMPGGSAVFERAGGGAVAVFVGEVLLPSGQRIGPGTTCGLSGNFEPQPGGYEVRELVRRERRVALGDLIQWRAFVVDRVLTATVVGEVRPAMDRLLPPRGLDGGLGSVDLLVEESNRASPFRPEEVRPPP